MGKSPAEIVMDRVRTVAGNTGDVNGEGVGGGDSALGELKTVLSEAGDDLESGARWGKVAGWAGILLVGVVAGVNDYSKHGNVARAVGVGALHSVLSAGGAFLGGALIGAAGAAIGGPVGLAVGTFIGASVGAAAGDWLAGQITDQFDNGNVARAQSDIEQGLTNLGGGAVGIFNGVTSMF
jgi:hypothetical protein